MLKEKIVTAKLITMIQKVSKVNDLKGAEEKVVTAALTMIQKVSKVNDVIVWKKVVTAS